MQQCNFSLLYYNLFAMNETATYNETIIVATLVIAMNYFFRCYMYQFLQRKRLLYTTEHIRGDIDGLLQP